MLDYVIDREIRRQADWRGRSRKLLGGWQVSTDSTMKIIFWIRLASTGSAQKPP